MRCSNVSRGNCRAASASASRWAARSCAIPPCSCSTSRCPISTPSCACRCAPRSSGLQQRLAATTVYVTHDQIEAMTMADKIVVLREGIVEQIGAPLELYDRPANIFVAGFIGSPAMNILRGRLEGGETPRLTLASGLTIPLQLGAGRGARARSRARRQARAHFARRRPRRFSRKYRSSNRPAPRPSSTRRSPAPEIVCVLKERVSAVPAKRWRSPSTPRRCISSTPTPAP